MLRRRNIQQGVFTVICKTRWSWTSTSGVRDLVKIDAIMNSTLHPAITSVKCVIDNENQHLKNKNKKAKVSFRKPGEVILKTVSRQLIQENSICVEELRWYYQIFIFWFIWIVDAVFLPYVLCFHVCLYMFLINN